LSCTKLGELEQNMLWIFVILYLFLVGILEGSPKDV
jgi:hypothetical protein